MTEATPIRRGGTALLEAVVALAILGIAATVVATSVVQSTKAVEQTRSSSRALTDANAFLESVALWPRADLDRHLGHRREGSLELFVERRTPSLYYVAVTNAQAQNGARRLLLETTLFREIR